VKNAAANLTKKTPHNWGKKFNKAEKILRKIEKKASNEFLPIVSAEKGRVLAEEVRRAKPKLVLEVGTLIGYSAILMGNELDETAHIITIEIHAEEAKTAEENIRKAEIPPKVEVITGDAIEIISQLKGAFDFVFIDAKKTEYMDYLQLVEDKLCKGAVIVADNAGIFAKQMTNYLEYVRRSGKYSSKYVPVDNDGLEITVKL
jgi:predicted O-methyltransferase YrrM